MPARLHAPSKFQSTPAIAGRRIYAFYFMGEPMTVSIHSGHCWPENPYLGQVHRAKGKFQSTPAIAGRRISPAMAR